MDSLVVSGAERGGRDPCAATKKSHAEFAHFGYTGGVRRLSEEEFDKIVRRSIRRIPREIRRHLDNVLISVQRRPSKRLLRELGLPPGDTLLGFFEGVPLTEQSVTSPPLFPATIFLYQEPLEDVASTMEDLEREIEITVVHEVAHFVGIDEERLIELGYG